MGADKYSAEPRSQVFAFLKIMHAQGSSSEKLPIRMRNPCNRQFIPIHVRLQFFDSSLRGFFAKNRVPLLEEPLRQLRDVFWMLNQVANSNSTHINSTFRLTCPITGTRCVTQATALRLCAHPVHWVVRVQLSVYAHHLRQARCTLSLPSPATPHTA